MHVAHKFSKYFNWNYILLIICVGIIYYCYVRLSEIGWSYEWHWNRAWRSLGHFTKNGFSSGPLLEGIGLSIAITIFGLLLSTIWGLILCIFRLSNSVPLNLFAKIYINLFRNTPLLLQLFFVYFLISPLFHLGPFGSALLALSAFEAAYAAELFRGAFLTVSRAQWEAGLSLGLNLFQCLVLIILPQALRNGLPAFTNQSIAVLKDSSLVSAIAVADITMRAQAIVAETFLAFEVWLIVAAVYLILALCFSLPALYLEKRVNWRNS